MTDKYDEEGERMCLTWTSKHRKVVAPVEIPCGMCQTFAQALRSAAADAFEEAAGMLATESHNPECARGDCCQACQQSDFVYGLFKARAAALRKEGK